MTTPYTPPTTGEAYLEGITDGEEGLLLMKVLSECQCSGAGAGGYATHDAASQAAEEHEPT